MNTACKQVRNLISVSFSRRGDCCLSLVCMTALQATEKQQGLKFVPDKLPTGSMLLEVRHIGCVEAEFLYIYTDKLFIASQLIYKQMEEQAAAQDTGAPDSTAEEETLLRGGDQDYPKQLVHAIESLHESSVISICAWPGQSHQAVTGSGMRICQAKSNACYSNKGPPGCDSV